MQARDGAPLRARPGYFETRRSSRHPWVAAHVTQDSVGRYGLILDGVPSLEMWEVESAEDLYAGCILEGVNAFAHPLLAIWLFGREITEESYQFRLSVSTWAKQNDPSHPAANPDKPINMATLPIGSIV